MRQHFYCRHRIRLEYPHMKCVVEEHNNGHRKYFPIELLDVIIEDDSTNKDWDAYENDEESMDLSKEKDIFQVPKKYMIIRDDIFCDNCKRFMHTYMEMDQMEQNITAGV